MAGQKVGVTAIGTAICRLIEEYQPEEIRVCHDTLAKDMILPFYRFIYRFSFIRDFTIKKMEEVAVGIYGAQVCRTRCIDDSVERYLPNGFSQVVILGAGLDSRAYRLPGMEKVRVFEVDLPEVQNAKRERIRKIFGRIPGNVSYIPFDFSNPALEAMFSNTGFDLSRKTIFIWEGVTQYLTDEDVRRTLAFVEKAEAGSLLIFTYVLRGIIERRVEGSAYLMDRMAKQGSPWFFGLEPSEVPSFLQLFHLGVIADYGKAEYQKTYLAPMGRKLAMTEAEHTVIAAVE